MRGHRWRRNVTELRADFPDGADQVVEAVGNPAPLPSVTENQRMVLNEKLSAKALVTHRFPLEALPTAYDQFAAGDTLKVMVTP